MGRGSWVEVERSGIRHIASGLIGNDRDIVAYLVLIRVAFEGIKRIAHRNVRCPGDARVSAKGIEQLGVSVIGSVARIIPDRIQTTIGCNRKCSKPVPFVRVNRVVIDLHRRAKS